MSNRKRFRAIAGLTTVLIATLALAAAPGQASKQGKVFWLDLSGGSSVAPHRVFFTANAGGYMKKISWKRWGKNKTVGRGTFGTTAPCNGQPCPKGPAKMILRKPVTCTPDFGNKEGKTIRVYRFGKLFYPDSDGSRLKANLGYRTGWGACKEAY
ncbi:MAG: hypothetical protein WBP55_07210 [Solirubrobacterales bacterium]